MRAFLESLLMSRGHFLNHYWCPDSQDSNKVQQCQLLNQYKQTNAHTQKGNRYTAIAVYALGQSEQYRQA